MDLMLAIGYRIIDDIQINVGRPNYFKSVTIKNYSNKLAVECKITIILKQVSINWNYVTHDVYKLISIQKND